MTTRGIICKMVVRYNDNARQTTIYRKGINTLPFLPSWLTTNGQGRRRDATMCIWIEGVRAGRVRSQKAAGTNEVGGIRLRIEVLAIVFMAPGLVGSMVWRPFAA